MDQGVPSTYKDEHEIIDTLQLQTHVILCKCVTCGLDLDLKGERNNMCEIKFQCCELFPDIIDNMIINIFRSGSLF